MKNKKKKTNNIIILYTYIPVVQTLNLMVIIVITYYLQNVHIYYNNKILFKWDLLDAAFCFRLQQCLRRTTDCEDHLLPPPWFIKGTQECGSPSVYLLTYITGGSCSSKSTVDFFAHHRLALMTRRNRFDFILSVYINVFFRYIVRIGWLERRANNTPRCPRGVY